MTTSLTLTAAQERYAVDVDLFSPESLDYPYDDYRALRDVGRIAYMPRHDLWAVTRYDEVKAYLNNWQTFSSAAGIGISPVLNEAWKDFAPCKDGAEHKPMRQMMMKTLGPKAVTAYRDDIERAARTLVDEVVDRGEFDAVVDFAQLMPIRVFMEVLGVVPAIETRYDMLHWATDTYNCAGPEGTYDDTLPSMAKLYEWALANITRDNSRPGSVAALTWESADRGEITDTDAVATIAAYVTAGLDTTAGTLGNIMALFVTNPDQWAILRDEPQLLQSALYEGLRMDSVAQWFTRVTTHDVEFDEVVIPAGTRILHSYAAPNRDERKYPDPDRFDVRRNPLDMLAFGFGPHTCAGKNLSNMEMVALLGELVKRVDHIEQIGPSRRHQNNLIRSLGSLPVRVDRR